MNGLPPSTYRVLAALAETLIARGPMAQASASHAARTSSPSPKKEYRWIKRRKSNTS